MGVCIFAPPEPGSRQGKASENQAILIGSAGADHLERELRRYCQGEVEGRSFLVAGHRGAGKTTMVSHCVNKVRKESTLRYRPLLIALHGPNLVRGQIDDDTVLKDLAAEKSPEQSAVASSPPASAPPGTDVDSAGAAPDLTVTTKPKAGADPLAIAEYIRKLHQEDNKEADPKRELVQVALKQITLALHRALAEELTEEYRARIGEKSLNVDRRRDLYERAAQLDLELDQYTTPDRLRQFWAAGGFLHRGVLPRSRPVEDQGTRELVALAAACHAFARVSGTFAKAEVKQSITSTQTTTLSTAKEGLDLISPFLSILIGGLTGTAAFTTDAAAGGVAVPTAVGLVTALGTAAIFKYTSSRTRTRSYSAELNYTPDTRLDTLDRVLPTLIHRVMECGLAPVFVIDELDKIDGLYEQLESIVRHVKTIVAEKAFFCFLADRAYYERVVQVSVKNPYPKHFTYFTDRIFVSFHANDLHSYLGTMLKTTARLAEQPPPGASGAAGGAPTAVGPVRPADDDDLDTEVLPFVLLRRSEMHAVRLRRQIAAWSRRGGPGTNDSHPDSILFEQGAVRHLLRYRFDLLMQFAIELILHRPQIANQLRDDPAFARLLYDALYYPIRTLIRVPPINGAAKQGSADEVTLDLSDSGEARFTAYLVDRMSSDPQARLENNAPTLGLHDADPDFLLAQVRDLAAMLADPYLLLDELAVARTSGFVRASEAVLSALPLNPGTGPILRSLINKPHVYEWRYDHDWNPRS